MIFSLFLAAVVTAGTPLLFATLGALLNERAGNLNLGVEGMMLMGAVVGYQTAISTDNPYLAILAALVAGAGGALMYAFLTVTLRTNQVVTGLTLTIFGQGFAGFVGQKLSGLPCPPDVTAFFAEKPIPLLSMIPYIGHMFFKQNILVYSGYIAIVVTGIYLYRTRKGLNLRMVGESASAADAAGINVNLYKYVHILAGGALCGLGGAYLSLVHIRTWQVDLTAGRGWIAVALVIFCSWNPYKVILGTYLFGGLDILGIWMQGFNIPISQDLLTMLPYVATVVILIITSIRKNRENVAPKSLGLSYFREDR